MIELVISGGQDGADLGGWRAARAAGIPTTGWMPLGFLAESGCHPEYADLYGAREHVSPEYPPRTRANVGEADVTLWFGDPNTGEARCTERACRGARKPFVHVADRDWDSPMWARYRPDQLAMMIDRRGYRTVNVAGNRESRFPGLGARVEAYLAEVFLALGEIDREHEREREREREREERERNRSHSLSDRPR